MATVMPPVQKMESDDARQEFASVIRQVGRREARILLEESGNPVAAIVSAEDLRRLDRLDQERAERFNIIDEMRAAFQDVLPEELEREAGQALAEVRAEMRAEREEACVRS